MNAPGMYAYVDRENPANQAVIIVEAANPVHLPLITVRGGVQSGRRPATAVGCRRS